MSHSLAGGRNDKEFVRILWRGPQPRANNFFSPSAHAAGTKWRSFNLRIVNVIRASSKVDERPRPRRDGRFKAGVNFAGVKEVPNFLNHLAERSAFTVLQGCTCIRDVSFGNFASASICIVVQNPRVLGLRECASVIIITASGGRNHFFKLLRR